MLTKQVVIGTAGHVDHGKTSLTRALTGIDTDRLEEEKRRGMTIDLGFAPLRLPSGRVASIVDVPGHEKFIKNMVAGVTGIDMALLVIAADEGIMAQTREHVDILSLLDVTTGVVALTKVDLVDAQFVGIVFDEVRGYLSETAFSHAKIIPVSSVTGQGIQELINEIDLLAGMVAEKKPSGLFRIPVDRVFTIAGHGTVITGTVLGGGIGQGETVELLPSHKEARIRGIHVHNQKTDRAVAGDRAAINLAGIEKTDIKRGDVVIRPNTLSVSMIADVALSLLKGEEALMHNQRVRVHAGTAEAMARVRILGADSIRGGERGYAQLRFESPVAVARGDRFIVRSYSPMRTIGGGRILMHDAPGRHRSSGDELHLLSIEDTGSLEDLIELFLRQEAHQRPYPVDELSAKTLETPGGILELAGGRARERVILMPGTTKLMARDTFLALRTRIIDILQGFHREFPVKPGMPKSELRSATAPGWEQDDFDALLRELASEGSVSVKGGLVAAGRLDMTGAILQRPEVKAIEAAYKSDWLNPRRPDEVLSSLQLNPDTGREILKVLIDSGRLEKIDENIIFHKDALTQAMCMVRDRLLKSGRATTGEIRDMLGASRRVVVPLLEYFDRIKVTRRVGNYREVGPNRLDD